MDGVDLCLASVQAKKSVVAVHCSLAAAGRGLTNLAIPRVEEGRYGERTMGNRGGLLRGWGDR